MEDIMKNFRVLVINILILGFSVLSYGMEQKYSIADTADAPINILPSMGNFEPKKIVQEIIKIAQGNERFEKRFLQEAAILVACQMRMLNTMDELLPLFDSLAETQSVSLAEGNRIQGFTCKLYSNSTLIDDEISSKSYEWGISPKTLTMIPLFVVSEPEAIACAHKLNPLFKNGLGADVLKLFGICNYYASLSPKQQVQQAIKLVKNFQGSWYFAQKIYTGLPMMVMAHKDQLINRPMNSLNELLSSRFHLLVLQSCLLNTHLVPLMQGVAQFFKHYVVDSKSNSATEIFINQNYIDCARNLKKVCTKIHDMQDKYVTLYALLKRQIANRCKDEQEFKNFWQVSELEMRSCEYDVNSGQIKKEPRTEIPESLPEEIKLNKVSDTIFNEIPNAATASQWYRQLCALQENNSNSRDYLQKGITEAFSQLWDQFELDAQEKFEQVPQPVIPVSQEVVGIGIGTSSVHSQKQLEAPQEKVKKTKSKQPSKKVSGMSLTEKQIPEQGPGIETTLENKPFESTAESSLKNEKAQNNIKIKPKAKAAATKVIPSTISNTVTSQSLPAVLSASWNYHPRVTQWFTPFAHQKIVSDVVYHSFSLLVDGYLEQWGKKTQWQNRTRAGQIDSAYQLAGQVIFKNKISVPVMFYATVSGGDGLCYHRGLEIRDERSLFDDVIARKYWHVSSEHDACSQLKSYFESNDLFAGYFSKEPDHVVVDNGFLVQIRDNRLGLTLILYKP